MIAEYEKELLIKNITHINLSLPFVEHKLFQTGTVNVQAAGGSDVEVHFDSIDNPREMFELVEERMRHNGFALSSENRARHDRPHQVLVFLESMFNVLVSQAVLLFYIVDIIVSLTERSIFDQALPVYLLLFIFEFVVLSGALIPLGAKLSCRYSLFEDRCLSEVDFFFYRH